MSLIVCYFWMLGRHNALDDLTEIADLFVRNAITGRRLLLLSLHNLRDLGVQSVGHAVEIFVSYPASFLTVAEVFQ